MTRPDHAREVRNLLSDPDKLCRALGIKARVSGRWAQIACPFGTHADRNPSCSLTVQRDGTILVKCWSCDVRTDALGLVALTLGLDVRTNFREVLAEGARLGGDLSLANEISDGQSIPERKPVARPIFDPPPPKEYPPADEILELWNAAIPVDECPDASGYLVSRRICPVLASSRRLLRVLRSDTHWTRMPAWARHRGATWLQTGHRMLARAWDHNGKLRSLRAWRIVDRADDRPKRLPPSGHKAGGLVLANELAVKWLRGQVAAFRLIITEGEPDWVNAAVTFGADDAVIGIGSGSWNESFARRVHRGTEVIIATHADAAGDAYAEQVLESLGERCPAYRWRMVA
jgi:hypothetical protein